MRSDKQKEAARRNGAKSRGPVTDSGKQRAAQNSAKHYLTSTALLIPGESAAELEAHFAAYRERFRPADPVELDLVDNLAFVTWRQRRLWKREAELVAEAMERSDALHEALNLESCSSSPSGAWKTLCEGPVVGMLHRVEAGLRRAFDRTLKNLQELQAARPVPLPPDGDASLQNEPEPACNSHAVRDIRPNDATVALPPPAGLPAPAGQLSISLASNHKLLYKYSDRL
jgi:hypothetical protein